MTDGEREPRGGIFALWRVVMQRRHHERREVRRFTQSRRRAVAAWSVATGAVLFLAAFVVLALYSPIMSVREIRVEGTDHLDAAAVADALVGLEGQPLAQVSAADVGSQLESFILVQSYSVQRLPPSQLIVTVVERVPVGVVARDDEVIVVDAAGVHLTTSTEAAATLPRIEVPGDTTTEAFAGAALVSLSLPDSLRTEVETITASSPEDVQLTLRDGTEVLWGSSDDSWRKSEVFATLRAATIDEAVSLYDVSSPERPVTR